MAKKKTICKRVSDLTLYIDSLDSLTKEEKSKLRDEIWDIKVSAQHMENRLFKYMKAIELLGFRRDRRIKAKLK